MTEAMLTHLLVPIANVEDAERTCENLERHLDPDVERITVVFVIEQTEGYMDAASPEALKQEADQVFSYVEDYFSEAPEIRRELRAGTDAVEEIVAAADELGASAIGFSPRPKTRLHRLLGENSSYRLITESDHPVVVFSKDGREGE